MFLLSTGGTYERYQIVWTQPSVRGKDLKDWKIEFEDLKLRGFEGVLAAGNIEQERSSNYSNTTVEPEYVEC